MHHRRGRRLWGALRWLTVVGSNSVPAGYAPPCCSLLSADDVRLFNLGTLLSVIFLIPDWMTMMGQRLYKAFYARAGGRVVVAACAGAQRSFCNGLFSISRLLCLPTWKTFDLCRSYRCCMSPSNIPCCDTRAAGLPFAQSARPSAHDCQPSARVPVPLAPPNDRCEHALARPVGLCCVRRCPWRTVVRIPFATRYV